MPTRRIRRRILILGAVVFGLALAIQLVPYGWHHPNPPGDGGRPVAIRRGSAGGRRRLL